MAAEVVVFGHSFVNHLGRYAKSWPNLGLDPARFHVSFLGVSDGKVCRGEKCVMNRWNLERLDAICQRLVFLQIGGNDLSSVDCSVATLSSNIVSAAEYLICGHGVKHVMIGQLLPRFSARCRSDYKERVIDVNKMVEHKVAMSTESVSFWHQRGFWRNPTALLDDDGVHVNNLGMVKYTKNVRAAIGLAWKQVRF